MIKQIRFQTPRLQLVAADGALLRAALEGRIALAQLLGCVVTDQWPPELYDDDAIRWSLAAENELAVDAVWRSYFVLLSKPDPVLIGICGFKRSPSADGRVEIGYGVLDAYRLCGYATEASQALIALAYRHGAREVVAETFPDLVASLRVMEKCGMRLSGEGSEAGTVRYAHTRAEADK